MYASQITPETQARIDYTARAVDKAAQFARKFASIKLPPGFTPASISSPPIDPARRAVFEQAIARTKQAIAQMERAGIRARAVSTAGALRWPA